jgi:hypothetical protein
MVVPTFKAKTWLNAKQVRKAVEEASVGRLAQCAFLVEAEAKLGMRAGGGTPSKTKTGRDREYYNSMRGGYVIASKPGDPPHTQVGTLKSSIQAALTWYGTYVVGPTLMAWYGRIHEFGGRFHPKRPFMRPALNRARRKFTALFRGIPIAFTPSGRWLNSLGAKKGA